MRALSSRIGASLRGPAVVPRQHVAGRDAKAERETALDHGAQVVRRGLDRAALGDVVDPALHDQHVGARDGVVEARGDLVGALAPDPEVAELELGVHAARPSAPTALRDHRCAGASPSTASLR